MTSVPAQEKQINHSLGARAGTEDYLYSPNTFLLFAKKKKIGRCTTSPNDSSAHLLLAGV